MKKVLVTGGCGFIGSHLAEKLIRLGYEVLIIDNLSTGRLENIKHFKNKCKPKCNALKRSKCWGHLSL